MNKQLDTLFQEKKQIIESALRRYLVPIQSKSILYAAIEHSIFAGGKRLRPILLLGTYEAFTDHSPDVAIHAGCALEMLHCYSLVHDDLPCMDDDEFRRGKKTTHALYGEGIGLLTGDALLTESFHLLSTIPSTQLPAASSLHLLQVLSDKSGLNGMIEGQALEHLQEDLSTITPELSLSILSYKTAALFSAAFMMGAICAQQSSQVVIRCEMLGLAFGRAFQIADDYYDREQNKEKANPFQMFDPKILFSEFQQYIHQTQLLMKEIFVKEPAVLRFLLQWLTDQIPPDEL